MATEIEKNAARYEALRRINVMDEDDVDMAMEFIDDDQGEPRTVAEFDSVSDHLIEALAKFDAKHATKQ
jgi:hypothetical protein